MWDRGAQGHGLEPVCTGPQASGVSERRFRVFSGTPFWLKKADRVSHLTEVAQGPEGPRTMMRPLPQVPVTAQEHLGPTVTDPQSQGTERSPEVRL